MGVDEGQVKEPVVGREDEDQDQDESQEGHSGDFGNTAKMVGKMSKSVMQLISIGY